MTAGRLTAIVCVVVATAMSHSGLLSTALVAAEVRLRAEETSIPFPRVDMGTGLVVDPTGEFLLATTSDGTVAIWNLEDLNAEPEILDGGHWQAWTPVFIPDGSSRMFLWCTRLNDKYPPVLELWDFKNRKLLADRVFENDFGISVEPHGDQIISHRIDINKITHRSGLHVGEIAIDTLQISEERQFSVGKLHSLGSDELIAVAQGGVRRLNTRTWELGPVFQTRVTANPKRRFNGTAVSSDRNWMAWSTYPTQPYRWKSGRISMRRSPVKGPEIVELWNTKTEEAWELCTTKGPVKWLQFSPDGRYVASVGGSSVDTTVTPNGPGYGEITLFDVRTQKLVTRLVLEKHPFLYRCTFLPGSREILALHQGSIRGQPGITRITIEGLSGQ